MTSEAEISFGKVAVLMGGDSAEREISLLSGEAIYFGLLENNINAVKIDTQNNLLKQLETHKIDRAFIALHGRGGEDGAAQGLLQMLNIPYTGSDTSGSAIAMNKLVSKQVWKQMNFNTADYCSVEQDEKFDSDYAKTIMAELGDVLFIKPSREGSSVGMSKSKTTQELVISVQLAQKYDKVLIEKFVDGREYTVGIVGGKALPSISMVTPNEYYDYDAKYCTDTTKYFCPSGLLESEELELQDITLRAFSALGCSGWGRVDFIRDGMNGEFMLLEANTIPGMTKTSLLPKAAHTAGLSFSQLVKEILLTSLDKGGSSND